VGGWWAPHSTATKHAAAGCVSTPGKQSDSKFWIRVIESHWWCHIFSHSIIKDPPAVVQPPSAEGATLHVCDSVGCVKLRCTPCKCSKLVRSQSKEHQRANGGCSAGRRCEGGCLCSWPPLLPLASRRLSCCILGCHPGRHADACSCSNDSAPHRNPAGSYNFAQYLRVRGRARRH
jgi:hypothetical protein